MKLKLAALAALTALSFAAQAHFGMVIPDKSFVADQKKSTVNLTIAFAHPFEGNGMTMAEPKAFYVVADGKKTDLKATLKKAKFLDKAAWKSSFAAKRPGVYQFVVEPAAYWEPAEDKFIVHYTKVVVPAYGEEEGWDEPVGAKTEIVPLTRPFGNWAGNTFQGRVLVDGKPVPGAEVEVEYYNKDGRKKAPSDHHVTQVIKADSNGVFTYTAPWAGWWGFAALTDADYKLKQDGKDKDVELGAVLWTKFD
ncbi:MAG: DUF4198 domain-containing protein [Duodenibacillus sp.]|nr:DUF4198 domain-containing protein [Duodenibacillus sp.]